LTQRLTHDIAQLEQLRSRPVLRAPESLLTSRAHEIELLAARGRERVDRALDVQGRRTAELRATLRALSPASTLARGYAIAHLADGVIVRDAAQAPASTAVVVTVGRGSFAARSEGPIEEDPGDGAAGAPT
jgi:exodeoxyribonuclease VII large subunit